MKRQIPLQQYIKLHIIADPGLQVTSAEERLMFLTLLIQAPFFARVVTESQNLICSETNQKGFFSGLHFPLQFSKNLIGIRTLERVLGVHSSAFVCS